MNLPYIRVVGINIEQEGRNRHNVEFSKLEEEEFTKMAKDSENDIYDNIVRIEPHHAHHPFLAMGFDHESLRATDSLPSRFDQRNTPQPDDGGCAMRRASQSRRRSTATRTSRRPSPARSSPAPRSDSETGCVRTQTPQPFCLRDIFDAPGQPFGRTQTPQHSHP